MVKSSEGNGDLLPKQIGCMNGLLQLFDRRLLFIGRSFGSHHHKRLLIGAQQPLEPHNATEAVIEKDADLQKGRARESLESSEAASSLPSSHSSTTTKHPSKRGQSSDIREAVKDAMYREARGVTVKSSPNDERANVMKHIDSPRPLQRSKVARDTFPRFSYDGTGRETRGAVKTNMKLKELPRFSLDSKHSALESRLTSLCCEVPLVKKESGSHSRSSSIVTKLMGLDDFPDSVATDENSTTRTISSPKVAEKDQLKRVSSSQSASEPPRQCKAVSVRKTTVCSKLPLEPAPWKQQQDCSKKQSRKMAGKAPPESSFPSSSVYGQIEKRITELEFKRSGKDLRALKQILEAMQRTRGKLENQRREPDELRLQERASEDSCSPALTMKETLRPKQSTYSTGTTKMMGKVKISSQNQAHRERENYPTPMKNNTKDRNQRFPSIDKRKLESEHSVPQRVRVENCTASGRGSAMASPRMQLSKKVGEKCRDDGKRRVKSMDLQSSNDQLSSVSSETRYSSYHGDTASTKSECNNSIASREETDSLSSVDLFSLNSRENQDYAITPRKDVPAAQLAVITIEQPSPVSVLDAPFYSEGSPSPVKKISTAFQEDESSSPDEAEWNLRNLNDLAASTTSASSYRSNQKSENLLDSIHEPLLKMKPNETAYQSINQRQRYINKMLPAFIQMDSHLLPMGNIFDSNTFHALREEDDPVEDANEELFGNTDKAKLNQKIQRKIVADVANEILVRKITSGRLFTTGRRRMSLQGLIKEVHSEMEHLCRMPHCNVDDGDDGSIRALHVDMKYQLDDWTGYSGDVPALVLDIERLIFKDLVNEVITCEVSCSCRKLFTK